MYYQYYECDGYSAKVTIEWSIPDNHNKENLKLAEELADSILAQSGPEMREMVKKMRRVT